jgi:hypothetical protein
MNIRKAKYGIALIILISCNRDLSDDPIPTQPFIDIVINLSLTENFSLQTNEGSKAISGGVRGIIIYRVNSTTFYAYERNCSFQPSGACATVDVHSSRLFMIDTCCNSSFGFADGNPTGGPAWRPLLRYRTQLSGQTLTITDDVIN